MRTAVLALAVLALFATAHGAAAASFSCERPAAADQRAICDDRTLNDQDVRMALLYDVSKHFLAMGRRGALEDEQIAWLRGRRACGANTQCLAAAYAHRIERLQGIIDEVAQRGPF